MFRWLSLSQVFDWLSLGQNKCVNHKSFEVGPSWAVLCSMRSITWAWVSTHLAISLCRCFKMEYPTQSGFEHLKLCWLWVLVQRDIPLFWKREDLSKWASTTHTHVWAHLAHPGFYMNMNFSGICMLLDCYILRTLRK